jgi:flagellar basal-body rod modification protein FlgD
MDIATALQGQDYARVQSQVDSFNAALGKDRVAKQELGRDDFLKILLTQLTHQDPTEPLEDKEFIAQMAQFSTLEQMTNLSEDFSSLHSILKASQAAELLGREVSVNDGEHTISGLVESVTGGDYPQVLVNGHFYNYDDITSVSIAKEVRQ